MKTLANLSLGSMRSGSTRPDSRRDPSRRPHLFLGLASSLLVFVIVVPALSQTPPLGASDLASLTTDDLLALGRAIRLRSGPRLLEPDPRVRAPAPRRGSEGEETGVFRLLPRDAFVHAVEARQGGAYWSFTQRSHDYNADPAVSFDGTHYSSGFAGAHRGLLLDLGTISLSAVGSSSHSLPQRVPRAAWDLLWSAPDAQTDSAVFAQRLSDEGRQLGIESRVTATEGHTYLLRSVAPGLHDQLVVFHTEAVDARGHTLTYRVLRSFHVADRPRPTSYPAPEPTTAAAAFEPQLDAMDLEALIASAERVRAAAHDRLLAIPHHIATGGTQRPGSVARAAAGVNRFARILRSQHYDHVTHRGERGPAYYSFATQRNDYDAEPDLSLTAHRGAKTPRISPTDPGRAEERLVLSTGFYGGTTGCLLDLGTIPLADVLDRGTPPQGVSNEVWTLFRRDLRVTDRNYDRSFDTDARRLGLSDRADVTTGHTYLLRAVLPGEHDHLVAFSVVEDDGYGLTLAWRVVRRWTISEDK